MAASITPEQRAVLLRVDSGAYHTRRLSELNQRQRLTARGLELRGLLRWAPARMGRRLVVTTSGSWALGTFGGDE